MSTIHDLEEKVALAESRVASLPDRIGEVNNASSVRSEKLTMKELDDAAQSSEESDEEDALAGAVGLVIANIERIQNGELVGEPAEAAVAEAHQVVSLLRDEYRDEEAGELEPIIWEIHGAVAVGRAMEFLDGASAGTVDAVEVLSGVDRATEDAATLRGARDAQGTLQNIAEQLVGIVDANVTCITSVGPAGWAASSWAELGPSIATVRHVMEWREEHGDHGKAEDLAEAIHTMEGVRAALLARECSARLRGEMAKAEGLQEQRVVRVIEGALPMVVQLHVQGAGKEAEAIDELIQACIQTSTVEKRAKWMQQLVDCLDKVAANKMQEARLMRQQQGRRTVHNTPKQRQPIAKEKHTHHDHPGAPFGETALFCDGCKKAWGPCGWAQWLEHDAQHRRVHFQEVCLVELRAFHSRRCLYDALTFVRNSSKPDRSL